MENLAFLSHQYNRHDHFKNCRFSATANTRQNFYKRCVGVCHKCVPPFFCAQNMKKALKIKHFCLIFNVPQSLFATRFEHPTYRLGEPLNLCHLCSPMYRKVAFHQAFIEFRICFGSPKFTFVVRSLCLHFSRLLDFAKKGKRIICSCRRY